MLDIWDWTTVSRAVEWIPWDRHAPGTGVPMLPPLKYDDSCRGFWEPAQGRGSELGWKLAALCRLGVGLSGPDGHSRDRQ